jgi:alanine dehydrogenase
LPLYLSESDVESLLTPADAVPLIEACFNRLAAGVVENRPRERVPHDSGYLAVMSAVDRELGYAGVKSYIVAAGKATFVVTLFDLATGEPAAVVEADALGQRRTGAASGVAAKYLSKPRARTLGVIGCGWQAEAQVGAIRAAVPSIETVVAYCRTPERLEAFCGKLGALSAEHASDAARQDIVVTVTNSPEPVLRGEWLRDGALVCAVGANRPGARELDDAVLERAAFVCCDSRAQAGLESADLIGPVDSGLLDRPDVHELQEVVAGQVEGRRTDADVVVFKSNGLAAWDVAVAVAALERARARGVGREL